ncbi:MAG: Abi family protein, partial [Clostridia bacterium]|nr:Abi family protein [Clostridia bacterium]
MKKQFLTYSQQLDNLVREKGLEVPDRQEAIETLKHISYFALINGYKEPFRGKDGKYLDGVTFQDIRALYRFDVALSSTLLRYLLSCERHLKSLFGYHFIQLYGDSEQDYLNPNNYDRSTEQRAREVRELLDTMRDLAREESDQEYLGHYRTHYEEVPLWIIMHALTFGQLERLYWCAQPHLRDVICSEFPNLRSKNLTYVLLVLVHLRNTCAHNNPVYTFRLKNIFLPVMSVHHDLGLVNKEGKARAGQKDLFAGLLAMKLILSGREYCAL